MTHPHSWWQTGVIYQIYPRSFLDSNSDGIGDLPIARLMPYYGEQLDEAHLPFNFQFVTMPTWHAGHFNSIRIDA